MRVLVDLNKCQLYAQCCFLAPDVFKLEGEEVLSYHPQPDDGMRERVLRAAAACPVLAIVIEPDSLGAAE
jgi:ferredoxin